MQHLWYNPTRDALCDGTAKNRAIKQTQNCLHLSGLGDAADHAIVAKTLPV